MSSTTTDRYAAYDRALQDLAAYGPSLHDELFNHAPMVAEALCMLGHGQRLTAWIEHQRPRLAPRPGRTAPIDAEHWQSAVGETHRFEDWCDHFDDAIRREGWQITLTAWARRLAPGFTTAACHGVLRTAHAARALSEGQSDARLFELANGLAAWTAMYRELPGESRPHAQLPSWRLSPPRRALALVQPVPDPHRPPEGLITAGYDALAFAPAFPMQVAAVDLSGDTESRIDDVVVAFAELFLRYARSPFTAIVFAHAVTAAAAVRNLSPVTDEQTTRELLFRAWQGGCALRAAFAGQQVFESSISDALSSQGDDPLPLSTAAVAHGDDHVIKLTEACLSTYLRRAEPVLLASARRILELIPSQAPATGVENRREHDVACPKR